ncbi:glycosyltransferase family 4 protein [Candidatus Uhrbacteria bacterium]|nr:glycosyltransferase family 4 protein [Candidatus Uhrbacteria bacterium]
MRIGIDARMYNEGLGIGRYVSQLIKNLELIDHENEYVIFLRKNNWELYTPHASNFTKVYADIPWYSLQEQIMFPFILCRRHLDLMHFPHFSVPVLYRTPFLVTIHDLIMLNMPLSSRLAATRHGSVWYQVKYSAYRFLLSWITTHARAILTVSHASKSDIIRAFPSAARKIHVLVNGIAPRIAPIHPEKSVLQPYFLYVGNAYPHKNINNLLAAWKHLRTRNFPFYLTLCGQEDYFASQVRRAIIENGLQGLAFHIGSMSEPGLAWLYENAVALVAPSLSEGFGLPAVEALSYSLPVIASDIPIFHEVLGEYALYFNPHDPQAMAKSIEDFISQRHIWVDTAKRAQEIIRKKYDWKKNALRTLDIYKELNV